MLPDFWKWPKIRLAVWDYYQLPALLLNSLTLFSLIYVKYWQKCGKKKKQNASCVIWRAAFRCCSDDRTVLREFVVRTFFLLKLHVIFRSCSVSLLKGALIINIWTAWCVMCLHGSPRAALRSVRWSCASLGLGATFWPADPSFLLLENKNTRGLWRLVYRNQKMICEGIKSDMLPFAQTKVGRRHFGLQLSPEFVGICSPVQFGENRLLVLSEELWQEMVTYDPWSSLWS